MNGGMEWKRANIQTNVLFKRKLVIQSQEVSTVMAVVNDVHSSSIQILASEYCMDVWVGGCV